MQLKALFGKIYRADKFDLNLKSQIYLQKLSLVSAPILLVV